MPLELSIPAERTAPPKDLEIRPKQAKAWLDALPLAQSVESARQLRANLAALSRSKLETDVRIQLLEVYHPVVLGILEALDAFYSKSALPLAPKAKEALGLARDITMESAHGAKIAILEKTTKLIAFGAKKQVPVLVYRVMEYLAAGIRAAYKSYTPVTPGAWQEFHRLYLHAEKEGFVKEIIEPEAKNSIFDLYVELLLVSLTDPYRLSQGEVDKTITLIRSNKGLVTLGQAKPQTPTSAHFLVPCDTDRPPKTAAAAAASEDTGGANWRLLDANGIADRLRTRKQALESGNVSATMSKATGLDGLTLLAKLIALWGDPPKRLAKRDPMDTQVAICAGLKAVSHFVSLEKGDAMQEAEAIASGRTLPLVHIPDDPVSRSMGVAEWEVVNQSAGGIKVKRNGVTAPGISVGEVVGVKYLGRDRWTIGVVRWLTQSDESAMEFGIQFLSPAARAVSVSPMATTGGGARMGLMLMESEASNEPDAMLTPPSTYSDLREYEIEEEGELSNVRAHGLIEKTGRFELFQISMS